MNEMPSDDWIRNRILAAEGALTEAEMVKAIKDYKRGFIDGTVDVEMASLDTELYPKGDVT